MPKKPPAFEIAKAQFERNTAKHCIRAWHYDPGDHKTTFCHGHWDIWNGENSSYRYQVSISPGVMVITGDFGLHVFVCNYNMFEFFHSSPPDTYYLATCIDNYGSTGYIGTKEKKDMSSAWGYLMLHKFLSLVNSDGSPK